MQRELGQLEGRTGEFHRTAVWPFLLGALWRPFDVLISLRISLRSIPDKSLASQSSDLPTHDYSDPVHLSPFFPYSSLQ